jgi:hypothetical protein
MIHTDAIGNPRPAHSCWLEMPRSGIAFNLLDPTPDMVDLGDIAEGLAHTVRWSGQGTLKVSVAAHALHVCDLVEARGGDCYEQLAALHHDSAEAYTGDVVRPLKKLLGRAFTEIEERINRAIAAHFGAVLGMTPLVKWADDQAMAIEVQAGLRNLFGWCPKPEANPMQNQWIWHAAESVARAFMMRHHELRAECREEDRRRAQTRADLDGTNAKPISSLLADAFAQTDAAPLQMVGTGVLHSMRTVGPNLHGLGSRSFLAPGEIRWSGNRTHNVCPRPRLTVRPTPEIPSGCALKRTAERFPCSADPPPSPTTFPPYWMKARAAKRKKKPRTRRAG